MYEAMTVDSPGALCQMLGIEVPIMQAPMTFIANADLAAAVSNAGGLGVIETASPGGRADLTRVRTLTDRPVGANVAIAMMRDPAIIATLMHAGISFVTTSAGDPKLFTDALHEAGITVFHVVGSLRMAHKAVDAGVDGLVVEGVEGGGFKSALGASTMVLLPLVASEVEVPIVSAGGICDGRSMAAALTLGAQGVQMGTRMLASLESPVHAGFKQAIVDADEMGTVLVSIPGRPTMRVIRTKAAEHAASRGLSPVGLDNVHELYFGGDMEASLANTGQVAGRIRDVRPVAEIIEEMWNDCRRVLDETARRAHV
jgi:enoyl-[acyl-carrier protein] reductase II